MVEIYIVRKMLLTNTAECLESEHFNFESAGSIGLVDEKLYRINIIAVSFFGHILKKYHTNGNITYDTQGR